MSDIENKKLNGSVHAVLAHSYMAYMASFLLGFLLHVIFLTKISNSKFIIFLGFSFLFFATLLIFWAQNTSRALDKSNISKETFCQGPYKYVRMPTHFGLFLLIFGFGLLINSFFIILFALISLVANKLIFIKKEEDLLSNKYGSPYLEYKKSVRF